MYCVRVGLLIMRHGDHYFFYGHRSVIFITYGYLGFTVWADIGQDFLLPDLIDASCQGMCDGDRQGHELRRLVTGITEHHTLVTGTFIVIHPLGYFRRLL